MSDHNYYYFSKTPNLLSRCFILDSMDLMILSLILSEQNLSTGLSLKEFKLFTGAGFNTINYSIYKLCFMGIIEKITTMKANGHNGTNKYMYVNNPLTWKLTKSLRRILNLEEKALGTTKTSDVLDFDSMQAFYYAFEKTLPSSLKYYFPEKTNNRLIKKLEQRSKALESYAEARIIRFTPKKGLEKLKNLEDLFPKDDD